jgi:hypothetical protein
MDPMFLGQSFRSQSRWIPAGRGYSHDSSYFLYVCPHHVFVYTLLGVVIGKEHRRCCFFGLDGVRK